MNELADLSDRISRMVSRNDVVQIKLLACFNQHLHETFVIYTQDILDKIS